MYYEVYADVLFAENLWMNAVLLFLTARADRVPVRKGRLFFAAAAGAFGACVLTVLSGRLSAAGYLFGCLLLAAGMVRIAFPERRHFGYRVISLYLECFALNGLLRYLEQLHGMAGMWFIGLGSAAALLLLTAQTCLKRRRRKQALVCQALLRHGKAHLETEALFDTGNSLRDPINGRPVCILDRTLLQRLLAESGKECLPRCVPYRTISQTGVLEAYVLDGMELALAGGSRRVAHPLVAAMPGENRQYRLILHQDLLPSQEEAL